MSRNRLLMVLKLEKQKGSMERESLILQQRERRKRTKKQKVLTKKK
jgi:hypothetical protein